MASAIKTSDMSKHLTIGPEIWRDDNKLRRVFSWMTRIGAAPKFGTLPIGYYQAEQVKAIEALETALRAYGFDPSETPMRYQDGLFQAWNAHKNRWQAVAMLVCGNIVPR
jgi:hypothetical protein